MKKTEELSLQETAAFAKKQYANSFLNTEECVFSFVKRVAARAEDIAHKFYADMLPEYHAENKANNIAAVVHCAILSEVFSYSNCCFEEVAEISNVQVAAMVAQLSRDKRLVETKRDTEYRGRLSQSSLGAQIVAVARIICFAQSTKKYFESYSVAAAQKIKKNLNQMDADLLAIHAASLYYVLRTHVHAARNLLTTISQDLKKERSRLKNEKLVLQHTKVLRESNSSTQVAAKKKHKQPASKVSKPAKKKVTKKKGANKK